MYKRGNVYWCKFTKPGRKKALFFSLGKDRKKAKLEEANLRRKFEEGKLFDIQNSKRITIQSLLERYVVNVSQLRVIKGQKKQATVDNEGYLINTLNRFFGHLFLAEVTSLHLEDYERKRYEENVSEIAVHHELCLLKAAYRWAVERWDLLDRTPFAKYDLPNGDKQRVRFLEEWEEKELDLALSKPENRFLRQFVTIFHETLIRPINLCELELAQLNLEERFIHLGKTKNGEPNLVPLSGNAYQVFKEVLQDRVTNKVMNIQFANLVFINRGKPINTNIMGRWFKEVVRGKKRFIRQKDGTEVKVFVGGTKINDLRLYDMKHDRMTRERRKGATLSDLAEIAGQEDIRSTRRYAHQQLETKRRIVKNFQPIFGKTGEASK
ncbi:MAG: tyrosine-type recombinase/integrase [Nitrospina sp.]|jgi:site-specific recombinase XerD|nr:tyrosine-type recombinase/integrase [Nitrospina sp.]